MDSLPWVAYGYLTTVLGLSEGLSPGAAPSISIGMRICCGAVGRDRSTRDRVQLAAASSPCIGGDLYIGLAAHYPYVLGPTQPAGKANELLMRR